MEHFPGVTKSVKKDNSIYYRASITYRGKHISLGSFKSPQEATKAYECAGRILNCPEYTPEHMEPSKQLPFEKQVVLMNFRDHNLYISHPIYLRKHYFDYYYSKQICLKFDIDDLFYYSSHKIMKRGNHLFVADYGMQVNILNRYGIMSFAVPGRDYEFINGDSLDFRRHNLNIINRYRGVRREKAGNTYRYRTKILVNGSMNVGIYDTEDQAAIAYNKAIDILKKKGVQINYTPNYLEGLSPAVYAGIYTDVSISKNILNYTVS